MRVWTRALVTGASSGIGTAMARQLAAQGVELVITGRNEERLAELADELGNNPEVIVADLGTSDGVDREAQRITASTDPVDLVINNAGLSFSGPFTEIIDTEDSLTVAVNVVALHRLTRSAAAALSERGGGAILNVSSIAGDFPHPRSATYNATKSFVTSFSQAAHLELEGTGVTVTALCPGLTHSNFHARAGMSANTPGILWQDADTVAKAGLAAAAAGQPVVISGALNKVFSRFIRRLPRAAVRAITKRL